MRALEKFHDLFENEVERLRARPAVHLMSCDGQPLEDGHGHLDSGEVEPELIDEALDDAELDDVLLRIEAEHANGARGPNQPNAFVLAQRLRVHGKDTGCNADDIEPFSRLWRGLLVLRALGLLGPASRWRRACSHLIGEHVFEEPAGSLGLGGLRALPSILHAIGPSRLGSGAVGAVLVASPNQDVNIVAVDTECVNSRYMMQYAGKHVLEMGECLTPLWVDRYLICITTAERGR